MSRMFVPGPVDVDPLVLEAQCRPMLPHRSKEFEAIFRQASDKARALFNTQYRVFIVASSGTGLQEAAMRNLVTNRALVCVNGAFAERWYDVGVANGKSADRLDFAWNEPVDPHKVAETLKAQPYDALMIVHNETSTGLENPIAEIAAAARQVSPQTLICVDTVSSLGGVRFEMDAWGVDMTLASSQKCLGLPPGLALAAVSDRAMEFANSVPNRGWYFDLARMEKHRLKDSTPATPAMSLIFALDYQLDRIIAEGLENRYARHQAMAEKVQAWAESSGLSLFAPRGYRSKTVTTLVNDRSWDISALNQFLLKRDMRIANGYGQLKGKTFRIAHMGETQPEDLDALFAAMEEYLATVK